MLDSIPETNKRGDERVTAGRRAECDSRPGVFDVSDIFDLESLFAGAKIDGRCYGMHSSGASWGREVPVRNATRVQERLPRSDGDTITPTGVRDDLG